MEVFSNRANLIMLAFWEENEVKELEGILDHEEFFYA
jgi:hypothetical protein